MDKQRLKRLWRHTKRYVRYYRRVILLLVGVVVVCVAGTSLVRYAVRGIHERNLERELRAVMAQYTAMPETPAPEMTETPLPSPTPEPSMPLGSPHPTDVPTLPPTAAPTPVPTVQPKLMSLMERNPDSVGWLKAGCLSEIDLPIVQRNNVFYMNHSFDTSYNEYGTAFLDELCSLDDSHGNWIIYAHNMRTGQMFGKLNRLRDLNLLLTDPVFVLDTRYERINFLPIAVFTCSVRQSDEAYFPIIVPTFSSEEQFNAFVSRAKELSVHKWLPDAKYGERLMTLVTCYGEDDMTRFVVMLREMREGETRESIGRMF